MSRYCILSHLKTTLIFHLDCSIQVYFEFFDPCQECLYWSINCNRGRRLANRKQGIAIIVINSSRQYIHELEILNTPFLIMDMKDYQFWVKTDSQGNFIIKNAIPGVYRLHGWVPGFVGDYLDTRLVTISAGTSILVLSSIKKQTDMLFPYITFIKSSLQITLFHFFQCRDLMIVEIYQGPKQNSAT